MFGSLAAVVGTSFTFPISGLLLAAVAVSTRHDMAALQRPSRPSRTGPPPTEEEPG